MLFLAILILALGWAGWLWAWGRDRVAANHGFAPSPFAGRAGSRWGMPQTAAMAQQRRRDLLVGLVGFAALTLVFAQSWSALWLVHGLADVAVVAYALAVLGLERNSRPPATSNVPSLPLLGSSAPSSMSPLLSSPRMALQPIRDDSY